MIDSYERYALSWVPKSGSPLARFGASWTGWCADAGERRPRMSRSGLPMAPEQVTGKLGRRGLHAVIRAPFRLRPDCSIWRLEGELAALGETLESFTLPRLAVAVANERIALVPTTLSAALDRFLWQIDRRIAPFEAPADGAAGRIGEGDHFARFAIPLTRRLAPEELERLARPLAAMLEPLLREPQQVSEFALIGDPGGARPFRLIERFPLHGLEDRATCSGLPCSGRPVFTSLGARPEPTEIV